MRIAISALLSAAAALVAVALTDDPRMGLLAFAAVAAIAVAIQVATFRGFAAALLLFTLPPGVLGESSAMLALGGALGLLVLVMTYRPDPSFQAPGLQAIALVAMACPAAGLALLAQWPFVAAYMVLAVAACMVVKRRQFLTDLTRGLMVVFAVYVVSYVVTLLIGFGQPLAVFEIGHRTIELYLPITTATSGAPILDETRRGAPLIGEPGLVIFYLLPLVAVLFITKTPRARVGLFVLIALAALFTQSTATILVLISVLFIGLTVTRIRRRSLGTVFLVAVSAAVAVPALILPIFDQKNSVAAVSIEARGIGAEGGHENINILVALGNTPMLAAALIAGLALSALIAFRSIPGAVMWFAFAITAIAAQPSQWQVGAWFLLVAFSLHLAAERSPATPGQMGDGRYAGQIVRSERRPVRTAPR